MEFFRALGGGELLKDRFISGFLFNRRAIANYKRAKAMGIEQNFKGGGEIKGGLFIVGKGKSGIAYQFIERNFGDWSPLTEIIEICTRLQVVIAGFSILSLYCTSFNLLILIHHLCRTNSRVRGSLLNHIRSKNKAWFSIFHNRPPFHQLSVICIHLIPAYRRTGV